MKSKYRIIEVPVNDGELNDWGGRPKPYRVQWLNTYMEDGIQRAEWSQVSQHDNLPQALAAFNAIIAPNVIREAEVEFNVEG